MSELSLVPLEAQLATTLSILDQLLLGHSVAEKRITLLPQSTAPSSSDLLPLPPSSQLLSQFIEALDALQRTDVSDVVIAGPEDATTNAKLQYQDEDRGEGRAGPPSKPTHSNNNGTSSRDGNRWKKRWRSDVCVGQEEKGWEVCYPVSVLLSIDQGEEPSSVLGRAEERCAEETVKYNGQEVASRVMLQLLGVG